VHRPAIINRHCYPEGAGSEAIESEAIDVGRMALVLILNRLQAPHPRVHVETWLASTVLPAVVGLDAAQCNDDRLARTLDTLLPHLDAIGQDLVVAAITTCDLDLRYLCYDLTSLSFCGAYDEANLMRYGYSRDQRPDRKQSELAATVTAAGGGPVDYRPLAGTVADRSTPVDNVQRLQGLLALLPPRTAGAPCVVSDRAMLTQAALSGQPPPARSSGAANSTNVDRIPA
jgi:transposase